MVSHRIGDLISERPAAGGEALRFGGGKLVTVAGLIDEVKKRGPRVILMLDDRTGRIEVTLFEDVFQRYRDLIAKDALVLVEGMLRFDEFSDAWRLAARKITELDKVREQQARRLVLTWPSTARSHGAAGRLAEVLDAWRAGPCPITVEYTRRGAAGRADPGTGVEGARQRASCSRLEAPGRARRRALSTALRRRCRRHSRTGSLHCAAGAPCAGYPSPYPRQL